MDILWLGHPDCHELDLVGGKAASLSRLVADHRIPPGFCVTTSAFSRWAGVAGADGSISGAESAPPALFSQLADAYRDLAERSGAAEPSVAVRSSAVDEDGARASFAGQHETYLNIVGADAVAAAVIRCWSSAGSERALAYRRQRGASSEGARLAVLVQQLVPAEVSAVVFSANPVTGDRDEIMINASWGLGESVVGGTVTPDTFMVRKSDLAITLRQISEKRRMTVSVPGGTSEVEVPRRERHAPSVADSQAMEMAQLALSLENAMGWPVDIECAYHQGQLYLLQCRPITTL